MRKFDPSRHLTTPEAVATYLDEVLQLNDKDTFIAALGDVAKAQGMAKIAAEAGVGRESLYKSLSEKGNPSFETVMKVLKALGVQMGVRPKQSKRKRQLAYI
ncbi:addiction module antidote protein [Alloscardovia venturai]|uniref:Addiction module antidote protein n=1 Tax=Alloscardovia venturai TaxID=1769421 RepID=A0ABW2Y2B8_9BIFI